MPVSQVGLGNRQAAVPVGPGAGETEPVGLLDLLASVGELAVAV